MIDYMMASMVIIAAVSVLSIPIQMVRHLRHDLEDKLECGQNKFEKIVDQLEKCSDSMSKANANYSAVNAKLDMLINRRN